MNEDMEDIRSSIDTNQEKDKRAELRLMGDLINDELKLRAYRRVITNQEARKGLTRFINLVRWTRQMRAKNYYKEG